MIASAADVFERLENAAEAMGSRHGRFLHMLRALEGRLQELSIQAATEWDEALWEPVLERIQRVVPDDMTPEYLMEHFDEIELAVRGAYRRILYERDPHLEDAGHQVPKTEAEFDQLPDALDELRKRRRAM